MFTFVVLLYGIFSYIDVTLQIFIWPEGNQGLSSHTNFHSVCVKRNIIKERIQEKYRSISHICQQIQTQINSPCRSSLHVKRSLPSLCTLCWQPHLPLFKTPMGHQAAMHLLLNCVVGTGLATAPLPKGNILFSLPLLHSIPMIQD